MHRMVAADSAAAETAAAAANGCRSHFAPQILQQISSSVVATQPANSDQYVELGNSHPLGSSGIAGDSLGPSPSRSQLDELFRDERDQVRSERY